MKGFVSMHSYFVAYLFLSVTSRLAAGQSLLISGTYVVVAPQLLRPGSPYDVSVTILTSSGPVSVSASLGDSSNTSIASNQTAISSGSTGIIHLQIPTNLVQSSYTLFVRGTGGGVLFTNSTSVDVQTKSLSFFIQTDKATYKPGQTVRFRAIAVYMDLKPYRGNINVSVSDKSGNKIAQWLDQRNDTGVFTGSLQLSDQPPLGTWSITVVAKGNTVTKTFDVDEYVLPKFEVTVSLPPYYLVLLSRRQAQQDFCFTVGARYTYGQPVKGQATVNISVASYYSETAPSSLKKVQLKNGSVDVCLSVAELISIVPVYQSQYQWSGYTSDPWQTLAYRNILVVAKVNETLTGTVLSSNSTVSCTSNKYSLSYLDITPSSYKPGLTFVGFLKLSQYDGTPPLAADILSQSVAIATTYEFSSQVPVPVMPPAPAAAPAPGVAPSKGASGVPGTSYVYPYSSTVVNTLLSVPSSGYMSFSLDIPNNCTSVSIVATFNDTSSNNTLTAYKSLTKFNSRDSQGIQVSLDNSNGVVSAGQTASFTVKSTANITTFYYQLLSKGVIVKSDVVTGSLSDTRSLSVAFDSQLAQKLAPSARIVAWYITALGEVVSDSLDFNVDGAFANQVSVSFDQTTVQPEDNVTVTVNAYQGSYVGLLAVDQSVLLLKSGNDITQSMVLDELSSYGSGSSGSAGGGGVGRPPIALARRKRSICLGCGDRRWWPYFTGGTDSTEVFTKAGLEVMTNAFIYATPFFPIYYMRPGAGVGLGAPGPAGPDGIDRVQDTESSSKGSSSQSSNPSSPTVRKNFPETWIWSEETTGPNGSVSLKATVPDTITSWVLSAFAVSSDVGLGIAPTTAQVTVFKPFFISLNLPYSIVRGEEFVLQVNVFNYLSTSVTSVVTLLRSDNFKVKVSNGGTPANTAASVVVQIPANDAASASFWIVADTLGQIPIEVRAVSAVAADAVRIPLLVKPEGVPQQYSTSVFISLSPNQTYNNVLNVSLPSVGLAPDSQYIEVTAIGDLLGQSLNGLANLLQMPSGCGEQNMLNFAPDVYILKYLETTGQSAGSVYNDAMRFISAGYQRQLTYQRVDGSYSAFGQSDPSGSTWLSAFVMKSFHEAKKFIPVEDSQLSITLTWLLNGQYPNGSFFEPPNGRVIHTDMQGGSAGGVALTAYVLISLLENTNNTVLNRTLYQTGRTRAVQYLESQLPQVTTDPYSLSIICYALTLANSSMASAALQSLNALAITEDGMKYWRKDNADDDVTGNNGRFVFVPPYQQARSLDIETTSYALLIYARRGDLTGGVAIAKWIVAQRNANGGFSSTQDTVMALQALAEFSALTSGNNNQQQLSISLSANDESFNFETITSTNSLVLQSIEIPSTAKQVNLTATGTGVGLVQLNVKYNVNASLLAASSNVQLTVNTWNTSKSGSSNQFSLNSCASWSGQSTSGMAVIEVGLPSGFSADGSGLINDIIRRVDQEDDKLVVYLDQLNTTNTCVTVPLSQTIIVGNVQPATVKAYLYYDPGQLNTVSYNIPSSRASVRSSMCTVCPDCCSAIPGSSSKATIFSAHMLIVLAMMMMVLQWI